MSTYDKLKSKISRRSFMKMAAIGSAVGVTTRLTAEDEVLTTRPSAYPEAQTIRSICTACAVGCGITAEVQNGVWVRQEVSQDHPISAGGHCCKGADMIDMVRSSARLKYPLLKSSNSWNRTSWTSALDTIANKLSSLKSTYGPDSVMFLGSAKMSTEQAYYYRKFAAFFGTNNIDHQARI